MRRRPAIFIVSFLLAGVCGCGQRDLPGRAEFEVACAPCHNLPRILARHKDREGWLRTVTTMRKRGATLTDEQAALVVEYLTVVCPPE